MWMCELNVIWTVMPLPQGPDYRLYKSEPELTTVAEVDESNGEDRSEHATERDASGARGTMQSKLTS